MIKNISNKDLDRLIDSFILKLKKQDPYLAFKLTEAGREELRQLIFIWSNNLQE